MSPPPDFGDNLQSRNYSPIGTYYNGIPSCPKLIAKSNPLPWIQPRSPLDSGYPDSKLLLPVETTHPISKIWDNSLGSKLLNIIDKHTKFVNSIDILKICFESHIPTASPIIWIGVVPGKLSHGKGISLIRDCITFLNENGINDVEIEIKESNVFKLGNKSILYNAEDGDWRKRALVDRPHVIRPFVSRLTASTGLPISNYSNSTGTGSFFFKNKNKPEETYLLTAGHVFNDPLPSASSDTALSRNVEVRLSDKLFEILNNEVSNKIEDIQWQCKIANQEIQSANDPSQIAKAQATLSSLQSDLSHLQTFQKNIEEDWGSDYSRIIGEVIHISNSTPVKSHDWAEDWALIQLDPGKFPTNLINSLDLSNRDDYHLANLSSQDCKPSFSIPTSGPLRLTSILSESDMKNENPILMRGAESDLRIGVGMPINSMVRYSHTAYNEDGSIHKEELGEWSRQWTIINLSDRKSTICPREGDSGAGVVVPDGRFGGIVTGGCGDNSKSEWCHFVRVDVTYVTPMFAIMDKIKQSGLDVELL